VVEVKEFKKFKILCKRPIATHWIQQAQNIN